MDEIPIELLYNIFSNLHLKDLHHLRLVNKYFRDVIFSFSPIKNIRVSRVYFPPPFDISKSDITIFTDDIGFVKTKDDNRIGNHIQNYKNLYPHQYLEIRAHDIGELEEEFSKIKDYENIKVLDISHGGGVDFYDDSFPDMVCSYLETYTNLIALYIHGLFDIYYGLFDPKFTLPHLKYFNSFYSEHRLPNFCPNLEVCILESTYEGFNPYPNSSKLLFFNIWDCELKEFCRYPVLELVRMSYFNIGKRSDFFEEFGQTIQRKNFKRLEIMLSKESDRLFYCLLEKNPNSLGKIKLLN